MALAIPPLKASEKFHLFVSYSSVDAEWTHQLISRLEADHMGLRVCLHERDFTPGRNILENMSECIQQSQKVLLVLSQGFVKSRWCLLEADLSLFGACLERKPVIPILLTPCQVPLHLSHLTYLEAADGRFYEQLVQLLNTPNHRLTRPPPARHLPCPLYSGKTLMTLSCINRKSLPSWRVGTFILGLQETFPTHKFLAVAANIFFCPLLIILGVNTLCWFRRFSKKKMREITLKVGEANVLLASHSVMMGCETMNKLFVLYVLLEDCKRVFQETFEGPEAEAMFQQALRQFSSSYACCLAHKNFPTHEEGTEGAQGHLEQGLCFCQFVSLQLNTRLGLTVHTV
ncbi:Toll-like receptor 2 type-1 [Tupaia chinensis]|uniref:Toll-like receptor 2 n=1 Tax=Tupaia chinensis TaxID=246437 RepID=L9KWJ1_TUPCH|nr:Toll-like receptor 2 type-1 [Tupaia chinensis]